MKALQPYLRLAQVMLCAAGLHAWSAWSDPAPINGIFAAFTTDMLQQRHCVRSSCNLAQRRYIDLHSSSTAAFSEDDNA